MSDSLKTRVSRVITGSLHALIDHLEDQAPDATMEQAVREADGVIDAVRHELGLVSANRHLAQQRHAQLNGQHETLAAQLEQALQQGRDDLARAAVARQLDIEAQIPVMETALAEQARQENELQGFVAALLAKRREMAEALGQFRHSRATAPGTTAPPGSAGQRIDALAGAFDRVFQRHTGVPGTVPSAGPQQAAQLKELDELVRENQIAERLARLKAGRA